MNLVLKRYLFEQNFKWNGQIQNNKQQTNQLPVTLSLMSLQLSTSPILENRDLISSCVMVWGK